MTRWRGKPGFLPSLLLAALLVGAQFAAVVHAFKHDIAAPQDKVCATCLTAAQLGAASIDDPVTADICPAPLSWDTADFLSCISRPVPVVRQRGPPAPLSMS